MGKLLAQTPRVRELVPPPHEVGMIVLSSEPGNDEASAAVGILANKLSQDVFSLTDRSLCCLVNHDADLKATRLAVVRARAVVAMLSSGTLDSWLQVNVILEAM